MVVSGLLPVVSGLDCGAFGRDEFWLRPRGVVLMVITILGIGFLSANYG